MLLLCVTFEFILRSIYLCVFFVILDCWAIFSSQTKNSSYNHFLFSKWIHLPLWHEFSPLMISWNNGIITKTIMNVLIKTTCYKFGWTINFYIQPLVWNLKLCIPLYPSIYHLIRSKMHSILQWHPQTLLCYININSSHLCASFLHMFICISSHEHSSSN